MKKILKKYYGFTLVELIIVITILAILSTIAFVSFQGYTKSARDGVRLETLSNIEKGLEVFNIKSGTYPTPDKAITISLSGSPISYQGTLGETSSKIIGFGKTPTDPLDNTNYYYATNIKQKSYSVISFAENQTAFIQDKTFADNSTKSTLTKGNLSYILEKDNNALTSNTDLFLTGSLTVYNQIINNSKKITGSGINIGGGYQMLSLKNGDYSAPKSCPEGFIPVVGSVDFSQPGFCVMKYEASYDDATSPNTNGGGTNKNTVKYDSLKKPVSKAGFYAIADITQEQAIDSCNKIGAHLITNNEWMTIARQIDGNSQNWSNGIVGSGYINTGVSDSTVGSCGVTKNIYGLPRTNIAKTGGSYLNQEALDCDKLRQLKLINSEIIWDLAGNEWEQVNKLNTLNGDNYDYGQTIISGTSVGNGWDNDGIYNFDDMKKYGSLYGYGQTYGEGKIYYGSGVSNNVMIRGGSDYDGDTVGIFTLGLYHTKLTNYSYTGFRCAY